MQRKAKKVSTKMNNFLYDISGLMVLYAVQATLLGIHAGLLPKELLKTAATILEPLTRDNPLPEIIKNILKKQKDATKVSVSDLGMFKGEAKKKGPDSTPTPTTTPKSTR